MAENVTGILMGNAITYVIRIKQEFNNAGYFVNHVILNASKMGVPQKRKRVFFYAIRKDLIKYIPTIGLFNNVPYLNLTFNVPAIKFKEISNGVLKRYKKGYDCIAPFFKYIKPGSSASTVHPKGSFFNNIKMNLNDVAPTLCSNPTLLFPAEQHRQLTKNELCKIGAFPLDYNFCEVYPGYIIGMSVPPVMIAQIAHQIKVQWIDKLPHD